MRLWTLAAIPLLGICVACGPPGWRSQPVFEGSRSPEDYRTDGAPTSQPTSQPESEPSEAPPLVEEEPVETPDEVTEEPATEVVEIQMVIPAPVDDVDVDEFVVSFSTSGGIAGSGIGGISIDSDEESATVVGPGGITCEDDVDDDDIDDLEELLVDAIENPGVGQPVGTCADCVTYLVHWRVQTEDDGELEGELTTVDTAPFSSEEVGELIEALVEMLEDQLEDCE